MIVERYNAGRSGLDHVDFHSLPYSHLGKTINESSITIEVANASPFTNREKFQRNNLSDLLVFRQNDAPRFLEIESQYQLPCQILTGSTTKPQPSSVKNPQAEISSMTPFQFDFEFC
jgi:hypothetical protein